MLGVQSDLVPKDGYIAFGFGQLCTCLSLDQLQSLERLLRSETNRLHGINANTGQCLCGRLPSLSQMPNGITTHADIQCSSLCLERLDNLGSPGCYLFEVRFDLSDPLDDCLLNASDNFARSVKRHVGNFIKNRAVAFMANAGQHRNG